MIFQSSRFNSVVCICCSNVSHCYISNSTNTAYVCIFIIICNCNCFTCYNIIWCIRRISCISWNSCCNACTCLCISFILCCSRYICNRRNLYSTIVNVTATIRDSFNCVVIIILTGKCCSKYYIFVGFTCIFVCKTSRNTILIYCCYTCSYSIITYKFAVRDCCCKCRCIYSTVVILVNTCCL